MLYRYIFLSKFMTRNNMRIYRISLGGFAQNLRKWSKYVTFFICLSHVLRFKKFLVVNDTGYNFCVL